MHVTHLALNNFRNYAELDIELFPGPNLFVGRNGQGKTNLVESLAYLATNSSHRVSSDQALINKDADAAVIRARVRFESREHLLEIQLNRQAANRAKVNRSEAKPRELSRYAAVVVFAPEDLSLVKGDPSGRRRFLDELLVQRWPRIAALLADYDRVVKQRTALLKSARGTHHADAAAATLSLWNDKLVSLGSQIVEFRLTLLADLAGPVADAYRAVAGVDQTPELALATTLTSDGTAAGLNGGAGAIVDQFTSGIERVAAQERERGQTLIGPHRDDVEFRLNGLPAKGYASHGESWSFALALRLGSAQLLRQDSAGGDPILILDDVFAELDRQRRAKLAEAAGEFEQVLITSAVLDDVPDQLVAHTVHIEGGAVVSGS